MAALDEDGEAWCHCVHPQGEACAPGTDLPQSHFDPNRLSTGSTLYDDALLKRKQDSDQLPVYEDAPDKALGVPASGGAPIKDLGDKDGVEVNKMESEAEPMSKATIVGIMFALGIALFLAALDVTIITTSLPTIATAFETSAADYTWIGSSYLVACAGATPVWGKLSDIWGRKPGLLLANLVFCAGSLVSALSLNAKMLIGGRVLQGIGGGGLVILVNICVSDLFSMRERGKYLGILGATWAIASGIGPLIGGLFSEKVSWRWCFYINLPLDGIAFLLLILFLKVETPKTPFIAGIKAIDWLGVVTIVGGVVMFLLGLEAGGVTHPWGSAFTLSLIISGAVTFALFFVIQWKVSKYPIMPLRLFNQSNNVAAIGVTFCHGFAFIGGTYYLPLYFQTVLTAPPLLSGVYLLPLVLTLSSGSAISGIIIKKTGRYQELIWFGMALMALGFGLLTNLPDHAEWSKIIVYQLIAGTGIGPNFQSPLIALQSHVARHDIAVATGTFGLTRTIATSMSVVLGNVIFENMLSRKGPELTRQLGPEVAAHLSGARLQASTAFIKNLPLAQKLIANQAITSSLHTMFLFYTAVIGFGLFLSVFVKKKALSNVREKAQTGLAEQERVRLEELEKQKLKRRLSSMTMKTQDTGRTGQSEQDIEMRLPTAPHQFLPTETR